MYKRLSLFYLLAFSVAAEETVFKSIDPIEKQSARIYRTPDERREAGLGREITEWLKVSGLVEIEKEYRRGKLSDTTRTKQNERPTLSLQLGLDVMVSEWLAAELIVDTETNGKGTHTELDEGLIGVEIGDSDIEAGRLNLPFGEYYSHFISAPMLEFGETRGDALVFDYSPVEMIRLSAFVFDSHADKQNTDGDPDWGFRFEYTAVNDAIRIGGSYLSDLAESDKQLLDEQNNTFHQRVSAWNVYTLVGIGKYELTAETVRAIRAFAVLNSDADKPSADNIELAYLLTPSVQFAIRAEQSDELYGQPELQYGISATWRPGDHLTFATEYLHGNYKRGFVLDENGNALVNTDFFAVQIALEF